MYDKIQEYLRQHYSLRWISKKLRINYRTLKKYQSMSREEYESYIANIGVTRKQKYSENGNRGTAKSGTRIQ